MMQRRKQAQQMFVERADHVRGGGVWDQIRKPLQLAGTLKVIWSQPPPTPTPGDSLVVHKPLAKPFSDRWGWSLLPRTDPPQFTFITLDCTVVET